MVKLQALLFRTLRDAYPQSNEVKQAMIVKRLVELGEKFGTVVGTFGWFRMDIFNVWILIRDFQLALLMEEMISTLYQYNFVHILFDVIQGVEGQVRRPVDYACGNKSITLWYNGDAFNYIWIISPYNVVCKQS